MNKSILIGNISTDIDYQLTSSGIPYARFNVACQRRAANAQGVREADFIGCVAFRQTAETIAKYFVKGMKIGIEGHIQTRTYTAQDGSKRFSTAVVVDNFDFCGKAPNSGANDSSNSAPAPQSPAPAANYNHQTTMAEQGGFTEVDDEELPF